MRSRHSYSALELYRSCPKSYWYRYVERPDVTKRVSADLYLGDVVHRALEILYKHGADGVLYPLEDIVAFSREQWDKPEKTSIVVRGDHYGVDDYIRMGEKMLTDFYQEYQPFDQGKLLGAESNLSFTLPGTPFVFVAKIDRLFRRDDGVVEVCDYKTGRNISSPSDRRFLTQMGLYELAVRAKYPQIEAIELAQYYLRSGEIVRHQMTPDQTDILIEELRLAVVDIGRAERLDDFPAKEGGQCGWCDFEGICPARAHRRLIDKDTGDSVASDPVKLKELAEQFLQADLANKKTKAAKDKLRAEIIAASRESGLTRFEGDSGAVTITIKNDESLPSKTRDKAAFHELQATVREMELDECLVVDGTYLLRGVIQKERLPADKLERLRKFVRVAEKVTVRGKLNKDVELSDGE